MCLRHNEYGYSIVSRGRGDRKCFLALSSRFKISSLIAGASLLAIASSAPEFFTALSGVVIHGIFDIGFLTIIWSALFNLCFVLGLCTNIQSPMPINPDILKRDFPAYGLSIASIAILALDGKYSSLDFWVLICFYVTYSITLYFDKSSPYTNSKKMSGRSMVSYILFGIIAIGMLSHLLVSFGVKTIATVESTWHVTIPVSLIAVIILVPSTSLPDLFVSMAATRKGESTAAVANGIGSNTFDLTICLGVPGLLYTLLIEKYVYVSQAHLLTGFVFLILGYILAFAFAIKGKHISRFEGNYLVAYFIVAIMIQVGIHYYVTERFKS